MLAREVTVRTDCCGRDTTAPIRTACFVIEDHYSKQRGTPTPMDMEWAKDGLTGELFIVQARPETVQS